MVWALALIGPSYICFAFAPRGQATRRFAPALIVIAMLSLLRCTQCSSICSTPLRCASYRYAHSLHIRCAHYWLSNSCSLRSLFVVVYRSLSLAITKCTHHVASLLNRLLSSLIAHMSIVFAALITSVHVRSYYRALHSCSLRCASLMSCYVAALMQDWRKNVCAWATLMWSFAPRGIFGAKLLKKYPAVGSFAPKNIPL
jgi:hypothetical protein